MSEFPSLKPAFTAQLKSGAGWAVGNVAKGDTVQVVPIVSGTLRSEKGYGVDVDAEFQHGADTVRILPTNDYMNINVDSVFKTKSGSYLVYKYTGMVAIDAEVMAIFTMSPDKKTTAFGRAFTQIKFETGDQTLRPLEHGIFVGSAHFVVGEDGDITIETKISQVIH